MTADTEPFLIDESILSGRVIPAISDFLDRGDSTAAKQLVREAITSQQFQTTLRSSVVVDRDKIPRPGQPKHIIARNIM
jgi:hypothetical protein